jgi:NAD(P)H-hydrate repair Nnr-like enzyme with NAD(P)H-hydrate dehydratase domain
MTTKATKTKAKTAAAAAPVTIDEAMALALYPTRAEGAHKWSAGGVIVVGGSPGYVGAPALAGLGAARSGAGVVAIACPRSAISAVAGIMPEAVFLPMPEGDLGAGGRKAVERIREKLEQAKALVVGPGLGDDDYADAVMTALTAVTAPTAAARPFGFASPRIDASAPAKGDSTTAIIGREHPTVLDADALNWLAKREEWWTTLAPFSCVLTPHPGEMARLLGIETDAVLANPATVAADAARTWQQTVVLKGAPTLVSDGTRTLVAPSSPRALATAGSGDVFAGSIGAFLAQGLGAVDAAALAIWCGCDAATALSLEVGTLGIMASDLPLAIAEALGALEARKANDHA